MKDYAVASCYAKALFEIDLMHVVLTKRVEDFAVLLEVFDQHPELENTLLAPQLEDKDKKDILLSILDGRLDETLLNFLFLLVEKKRWDHLNLIARAYRLLVNKHLDIWEAELITAVPIDKESEEILKQKLKKAFNKKQIHLKNIVHPAIIGGATLLIESEMIDWSISGKLNKMKKSLLASIGEK